MKEVWLTIVGLDKYEISSIGKIRGKKLNKILKTQISNSGYELITLRNKKKSPDGYSVHRLVAKTFLENPENKPFVNHKNGIKTDNRLENLEWVTTKENMSHAIKNGLIINGSKINTSKLKAKDVLKIRKLLKSGKSGAEIARKFKVSNTAIYYIKYRRNWWHI